MTCDQFWDLVTLKTPRLYLKMHSVGFELESSPTMWLLLLFEGFNERLTFCLVGLAKILKKYDKRTGGLLRLPFIQKVLEQPFFTTDLISKLVKECESIIDAVFPAEEEAEKAKEEAKEAIVVAGEGIFRNTVSAWLTMQEIRKGSSTQSPFSLPPLNLPDSDLIQSILLNAAVPIV